MSADSISKLFFGNVTLGSETYFYNVHKVINWTHCHCFKWNLYNNSLQQDTLIQGITNLTPKFLNFTFFIYKER